MVYIMVTQTILRESVKEAPVKKGNRWRVIVAKPGQGSSGYYSEELFERDAHKIIAPGGQAYINHDENRDPQDMIGVYPDGAFWSKEEKAVIAELEVFSHWSKFVEEVGPHCGMSLYALGEQDEDGNVTAFIEDVYNGADLVARPGLVGSGLAEKLYEAAKAGSAQSEANVSDKRKDEVNMDEVKELAAKVDKLTVSVEALVSAQTAKAEESAQIEADEKAVEERVATITANLDAVEAARDDLLPSQIESLRAEAKSGKDVAPLIETAKSYKAELEKDLEARLSESGTTGRVLGSSTEIEFTGFGGKR